MVVRVMEFNLKDFNFFLNFIEFLNGGPRHGI